MNKTTKSKTISKATHTTTLKSIRFPEPLCSQLAAEAEQSGKSFSAVVIDRLTQATPVVFTEGTVLAQLLFDLSAKLGNTALTNDVTDQVTSLVEQFVDLIYEIREKYKIGGDEHGNSEGC